jgi:hypothetical protein
MEKSMYLPSRWLFALAGLLLTAGCVTINIYFPAAAAEKAADRIIDEVWQLRGGDNAQTPGVSSQGDEE